MQLQLDVARYVRVFTKYFPKNARQASAERLSRYIIEMMSTPQSDANLAVQVEAEVLRLLERRDYVESFKNNTGIAQRTPEWYAIRKLGLTASDLAQANNKGKFGNREALLMKKLGLVSDEISEFAKATMEHGTMFEDMAVRCYKHASQDVTIHEFGLLPHKELPGFGASPDGITEWGRMVEIKCPPKRELTGTVPEQYYLQMQGQMAVTGLTETDYVEVKIIVLDEEEYLEEPDEPTVKSGVVLRFLSTIADKPIVYAYSEGNLTPSQAIQWAKIEAIARVQQDPRLQLSRIIPWKLVRIDIHYVKFDPKLWYEEYIPIIQKFIGDLNDARARIDSGAPPWDGYEEAQALKAERSRKRAENKKTEIIPDFEEDSDDETQTRR